MYDVLAWVGLGVVVWLCWVFGVSFWIALVVADLGMFSYVWFLLNVTVITWNLMGFGGFWCWLT